MLLLLLPPLQLIVGVVPSLGNVWLPTSLEEMRAGDGGGLCRRIGLVGSNYVL